MPEPIKGFGAILHNLHGPEAGPAEPCATCNGKGWLCAYSEGPADFDHGTCCDTPGGCPSANGCPDCERRP